MQDAIGTAAYFTQSVSEECTMYSSNENDMENLEELLTEGGEDEGAGIKPLSEEEFDSMSKDELKEMLFGGSK